MKREENNQASSGSINKSPSNVILYDGVCNLCWFWVQFILKRDKKRLFDFAPLQSESAKQILQLHKLEVAELTTVVLVDDQGVFIRSSAILRVFRKLPMPWPLLYGFILLPRVIRDRVYGFIGRNRYNWFGRGDACYLPDKDEQDRFL